jgi:hypothetical protein
MKALAWHGKGDMRCDSIPDPTIEHARDAIIKVTACAICGSDLHIYDGIIPMMEKGDVLGHETMGVVVEVGSENKKLKVGDPRRRAVHDLLRRMLLLQACFLFMLRTQQSRQRKGREVMGAFARPLVRIFASPRRVRGRAGRVSARALCGCRSHQGAGREGEIDPSFVITHRAGLEEGPELYKTFREKKNGCIKVVLKP